MKNQKPIDVITGTQFDKIFDDNKEDILQYCDTDNIIQPNLEIKKVNVDFTVWMVNALDRRAKKLNISRQSVIKQIINNAIEND